MSNNNSLHNTQMAPTTHGNSSTSSKGSIWCLAIVPNLLRDRTFSIFLTRDIRIMNWTTKLLKPSRVSPTSSMLQNALSSQAWSWELRKFTKWRSSAHDGSTTPQFLKKVHKRSLNPSHFIGNIAVHSISPIGITTIGEASKIVFRNDCFAVLVIL